MANFKYFAEIAGEAVQLQNVYLDGLSAKVAANFVGITPDGQRVRAQRMIEYKRMPSRHECDARCLNAVGRIMRCECSCGGKNHGRGSSLVCEAA